MDNSLNEFVQKFEEALELPAGDTGPDTVFRDLEKWDSLAALILLALVNSNYGVTLSGNDLRAASTLSDLWKIISAKR